jgi:hypothetical protein
VEQRSSFIFLIDPNIDKVFRHDVWKQFAGQTSSENSTSTISIDSEFFPFGWNSDTAVSHHCMSTYRDIKFWENWNINSSKPSKFIICRGNFCFKKIKEKLVTKIWTVYFHSPRFGFNYGFKTELYSVPFPDLWKGFFCVCLIRPIFLKNILSSSNWTTLLTTFYYVLRSPFYVLLRSTTFSVLRSTFYYVLRSTFYVLRSTFYDLRYFLIWWQVLF